MEYIYKVLFSLFTLSVMRANFVQFSTPDSDEILLLTKCDEILEKFAQAASNFTLCSLRFARPVRLCESCIEHYYDFQDKYKKLDEIVVNNTSCYSTYVSHDRLEVVLSYYNSISYIWTKGNCDACFNWTGGTPKLLNSTEYFNKILSATTDCIVHNMELNKNNSEEVCRKCKDKYIKLDNYYRTLSTDPLGVDGICMDLVDSMNATRSVWSKTLNCCQLRKSPEIIFLCCTGIISALPLLFYLVLRLCGPMKDLPNVLKQTRFKQTFLSTFNRRIN